MTERAFTPEALAILRSVRGMGEPLFSNMMQASEFDGKYKRGARKILPRTDGRFAVYDERRPVGARTESHHATLTEAAAALERGAP